jgi:predicted dehydrogenase
MPRIALLGCGRWGRNILRDLLSLGCEVFVADPNPEALKYAQSAGAQILGTTLNDLPQSDGLVIASPTSTHAAVIESALFRGAPIFVEKPMICNLADAQRLAERAEGRLFVMDKWRYHPGIEELRRICESGELGRCFGMRLEQAGWGLPHDDVDVIWILLPHCISIALEVLGHVPAARHAFAEQHKGRALSMHAVLGDSPWVTMEVSVRSPVKRREFYLHCEDGVAWLDEGWSDHIKIARGAGVSGGEATEIERRPVSPELPLLRELRSFVDHLGGGPPPRSSAREGVLAVQRISELRALAGLDR